MPNPLHQLRAEGQSVWSDFIRRGLLTSGEFQRQLDEYALTGVTANPTIFEKAIGESSDYDAAILRLGAQERDPTRIYEALATDDVRMVADTLRPIYDRTAGVDGFVSLEVSPELAQDTDGTIAEAKRLWREVGRANLMIKVPGTDAGLPAIEQLIAEGLNVNITLLFSVEVYSKVVDAYMAGLEHRVRMGQPIDRSASVASFFVSRVDTLVDKLIDAQIAETADPARQAELRRLQGTVAIANAKIAYQRFREAFGSSRFAALLAAGAHVQRPLWASTSTKNPAYRDVMYVEELIGPDTISTMPPQTLEAFRDHGIVARTVDRDVGQAYDTLSRLAAAGIDIADVTATLLDEGIRSFAESFTQLRSEIDQKLATLMSSSSAA